jgi:hypothetical protein
MRRLEVRRMRRAVRLLLVVGVVLCAAACGGDAVEQAFDDAEAAAHDYKCATEVLDVVTSGGNGTFDCLDYYEKACDEADSPDDTTCELARYWRELDEDRG